MMEASMIDRRQVLCAAAALALQSSCAATRADAPPSILFVCEHGCAKSLVASLHFQRMAIARSVRVRVMSRGVDPGPEVPEAICEGLARDGFDVSGFTPQRVRARDLRRSDYVVLISVNPDLAGRTAHVLRWDDVSALSENYELARGELITHLDALLQSIQANSAAR